MDYLTCNLAYEYGFFSAVWHIVTNLRELQLLVYLWILATSVAVFVNSLTARRASMATFYVAISLVFFNISLKHYWVASSIVERMPAEIAAMSFLVFLSLTASLWSALAINYSGTKQRGWVYLHVASVLEAVAQFVDAKIDLVAALRKLSEKAAKRAAIYQPVQDIIASHVEEVANTAEAAAALMKYLPEN